MSKTSRRDLLKVTAQLLTLTGLVTIFGPIVAFLFPPDLEETPTEPVPAGSLEELPTQGKVVPFGRYPALVIPTAEGLRAYSAVCTHFACLVKSDSATGHLVCPCHDGFFDPVDGHVISGPPPTPLEPLPVKVVAGQIYVGGEE